MLSTCQVVVVCIVLTRVSKGHNNGYTGPLFATWSTTRGVPVPVAWLTGWLGLTVQAH